MSDKTCACLLLIDVDCVQIALLYHRAEADTESSARAKALGPPMMIAIPGGAVGSHGGSHVANSICKLVCNRMKHYVKPGACLIESQQISRL